MGVGLTSVKRRVVRAVMTDFIKIDLLELFANRGLAKCIGPVFNLSIARKK